MRPEYTALTATHTRGSSALAPSRWLTDSITRSIATVYRPEPLDGIALHPRPIPLLETPGCSLVDRPEPGHVFLEPLQDPVGAQVGQTAVGQRSARRSSLSRQRTRSLRRPGRDGSRGPRVAPRAARRRSHSERCRQLILPGGGTNTSNVGITTRVSASILPIHGRESNRRRARVAWAPASTSRRWVSSQSQRA